jgi:hypothetical protein
MRNIFFIKCAFGAGTPYISSSLIQERIFAIVNASDTKTIIDSTFVAGNYNGRRAI